MNEKGWTRGETYPWIGCVSTSFWWNNIDFNTTILNNNTIKKSKPNKIYIDVGSREPSEMIKPTEIIKKEFESLGYILGNNLSYHWEIGGEHLEKSWTKRFYMPVTFLFPATYVHA